MEHSKIFFFTIYHLGYDGHACLGDSGGEKNGVGVGGAGNQSFQVHRLAATVETLTCHISSSQTRREDEVGHHPGSGDLHLDLLLTPPRSHHGSGVRAGAQSQPLKSIRFTQKREVYWHLNGI